MLALSETAVGKALGSWCEAVKGETEGKLVYRQTNMKLNSRKNADRVRRRGRQRGELDFLRRARCFRIYRIILLQMYTIRARSEMIDDCFDALKSINTMDWPETAMRRRNGTVNYFGSRRVRERASERN